MAHLHKNSSSSIALARPHYEGITGGSCGGRWPLQGKCAWKQCKKQWLCWFLHEFRARESTFLSTRVQTAAAAVLQCVALFADFSTHTLQVQRESSRSTVLHSFLLFDLRLAHVKVFFFPPISISRSFLLASAFRIPSDVLMHLKLHQTGKSAHSATLHGKSTQFTF